MTGLSTHVLDTALGKPAAGVPIVLERWDGAAWDFVAKGETDSDGRLRTLMDGQSRHPGEYRISFNISLYSARIGAKGFFPEVNIRFVVEDTTEHFHVPLLWSPFGFSTYRGS